MFSVIFEVRPAEGRKDDYLAIAREMRPILESIDGFIDNERFESRRRPGWILSHSTWRDEKSVIRWRTESRHHITQGRGRGGVFQDYHLRVGEITADTHPPAGHRVREQRFDATEIGAAPWATLTELTPSGSRDRDPADLARGIGLDIDAGAAAGALVEWDAFASIYNAGKMLVLGCWASPEAAAGFAPGGPDGTPAGPGGTSPRHRAVRIIRDYAMFDRREAPQYHPEVARTAA